MDLIADGSLPKRAFSELLGPGAASKVGAHSERRKKETSKKEIKKGRKQFPLFIFLFRKESEVLP
jgi:hypothetical protein